MYFFNDCSSFVISFSVSFNFIPNEFAPSHKCNNVRLRCSKSAHALHCWLRHLPTSSNFIVLALNNSREKRQVLHLSARQRGTNNETKGVAGLKDLRPVTCHYLSRGSL